MMNREQVKEVFKILAFAYPKFDVTSEKIDFWHKFLIDQDPAVVMKNAERHVMNNQFPPTIAELREVKRNEDKSVLADFWTGESH